MNLFKNNYENVLDVKSVAKILGVSQSYVYKIADKKEINFIKYPNALRFYERDVLDYLDRHIVRAVDN